MERQRDSSPTEQFKNFQKLACKLVNVSKKDFEKSGEKKKWESPKKCFSLSFWALVSFV